MVGSAPDSGSCCHHPVRHRLHRQQAHPQQQGNGLHRKDQLLLIPLALAVVGFLPHSLSSREHLDLRQDLVYRAPFSCDESPVLLFSGESDKVSEGKVGFCCSVGSNDVDRS